jgi:hypothetical protein
MSIFPENPPDPLPNEDPQQQTAANDLDRLMTQPQTNPAPLVPVPAPQQVPVSPPSPMVNQPVQPLPSAPNPLVYSPQPPVAPPVQQLYPVLSPPAPPVQPVQQSNPQPQLPVQPPDDLLIPLPSIVLPGTPTPLRPADPVPILLPDIPDQTAVVAARRIGVWGSGRSGKTTFIAALPIAADRRTSESWAVYGTDQAAAAYLGDSRIQLAVHKQFPIPNLVMQPISWMFRCANPPSTGWWKVGQTQPIEFMLELQDPPGRLFNHDLVGTPQSEALLDYLEQADGLLYLLDPLTENRDTGDSMLHFFKALELLRARLANSGRLINGRLPHSLAVCVTKFDDANFFRTLMTERVARPMIKQDSSSLIPYVRPERKKEFFDFVCTRMLQAGMIRDAIAASFDPARVQYFETSAIGFRLNGNEQFDFRNYNNVNQTPIDPADPSKGSTYSVIDQVRPINVIEPLIFLDRSIRMAEARR